MKTTNLLIASFVAVMMIGFAALTVTAEQQPKVPQQPQQKEPQPAQPPQQQQQQMLQNTTVYAPSDACCTPTYSTDNCCYDPCCVPVYRCGWKGYYYPRYRYYAYPWYARPYWW